MVAFTHIARVSIHGQTARAFVKAYDRRSKAKTLAEVVGYTVAKHVGLPQPPIAAIIEVPGVVLRSLVTGKKHADGSDFEFDDRHICYVTAEVVGVDGGRVRSFKAAADVIDPQWLSSNPKTEAMLFSWAEKWRHFGELMAFDAWTANVDRNLGNVLWISDKDFVIIDHGDIFCGSMTNGWKQGDWAAIGLPANQIFPHKLLDEMLRLRPSLPNGVVNAITTACERMSTGYGAARPELYFWLAGPSGSVELRSHHWLWKRLDDATLVGVMRKHMGLLI